MSLQISPNEDPAVILARQGTLYQQAKRMTHQELGQFIEAHGETLSIPLLIPLDQLRMQKFKELEATFVRIDQDHHHVKIHPSPPQQKMRQIVSEEPSRPSVEPARHVDWQTPLLDKEETSQECSFLSCLSKICCYFCDRNIEEQ